MGAEKFTFEAMFSHPRITGIAPSEVAWSPDGTKLAFLWNADGDRFKDLYFADHSGKIVRLTDLQTWPRDAREKDERSEQEKRDEIILDGGLSSAVWSRDASKIYFGLRGDLCCIAPKKGAAVERIWHTDAGEGRFSVSRDGEWLAYTSGSDLFALETSSNRIVQPAEMDRMTLLMEAELKLAYVEALSGRHRGMNGVCAIRHRGFDC
jgi:Tol biopolymer transport system component